jgi:protein-S-isoprenylcysteine O-methyltransferase Ste14
MRLTTAEWPDLHAGARYGGDDAGPHRKSRVERHRRLVQVIFWATFGATLLMTKPLIQDQHIYGIIKVVAYGFATTAAGRLWCSRYVRGQKSKQLCQNGPYSLCRNPLYLFSFLGITGVALASDRLALMILVPVLFAGYHLAVIRSEEKKLLAFFGEVYEEYCSRVPRIVPHLRGYSSPETVAVRVDHGLVEVMKAMGYVWILFLLELMERLRPVSRWVR